ncbi:glutamate dehydrogenase [Thecamonas trahens ATCC 50062]|uniref:Glutamate dehydrogenase n=1 Tax=Thecamonas trahens ATCC 50062 TaxID=461836 RepID=A0A0L0DNJ8_THETB|nr:glutamate dehydrogenase [Thecamonas trahens ATCC 50062]KNC53840.1 glutamate dehydrogenase [Thecamonas trahens ATCC 50062]|eukprot:XP_013754221.1 glutamate dehydrogenase [Thecamonas trahens ATCC 50062]
MSTSSSKAEEATSKPSVDEVVEAAKQRDPDQPEFFQAVDEVVASVKPLLKERPELVDVLARMLEPERVLHFRVAWQDDDGRTEINRGFRVVMNTACGPGKGGLRFHPSVDLSTLKFLAFEQTFKNALTGLPLGAAKGGSDFNPRGRSDDEVMRFCQAFMSALYTEIGPDTDVPAGDIGVGAREIGFLYGQYKRLTRRADGAMTGKGSNWGGSLVRPEATGYGLVYFARHIVADADESFDGAKCLVSGSGNVALHAAAKLISLGAKVVTLSDSSGVIHEPDGLTEDGLAFITELKTVRRGRIKEYTEEFSESAEYVEGGKPWQFAGDYAFPCATQNELDGDDAAALVDAGVRGVFEGANMPCTAEAIEAIKSGSLMYSPGKASNAGGVGVSGLEMAQNAGHVFWDEEEVDSKLQSIMEDIYTAAKDTADRFDLGGDLQAGANIAGFERVADAMVAQGVW